MSRVVDVGANEGQYGADLRAEGYAGRLLSIEPQDHAYGRLAQRTANDPLWDCMQCGLGAEDGEGVLRLSANGVSSSILPILDFHVEAEPGSRYCGEEMIPLFTLDAVVSRWATPVSRIGLKLDVQGFESEVLLGAEKTLPQVWFVESELSLRPLYEGQALFVEMIERLAGVGFSLVNVCPGFVDPRTGYVLQLDGIFVRNETRRTR